MLAVFLVECTLDVLGKSLAFGAAGTMIEENVSLFSFTATVHMNKDGTFIGRFVFVV